jgi:hypothetical protein
MENQISILMEAEHLVNGDRQADYGSPEKHFLDVSKIATVICGKELTPTDCVKVLIAVKLAREGNKSKRDNRVDACGYLELLNRVSSEK